MLLKYDSVQGRFPGSVEAEGNALIVNGKKVTVCSERAPGNLPWGDLGVEVALESTGFFTKRAAEGKPGYDSHLKAGAKKVVLSAPAKDKPDLTRRERRERQSALLRSTNAFPTPVAQRTAWHPCARFSTRNSAWNTG